MSTTFPIRIDPLVRPLLLLIGARRDNSWVRVDDEGVSLRFSMVRHQLAWRDIHRAERVRWPWYYGIGLRIAPRRTLGLIGSHQGVVRIQLRQPRRIKMPLPLWVERVAVSAEDPDALVERVNAGAAAEKEF